LLTVSSIEEESPLRDPIDVGSLYKRMAVTSKIIPKIIGSDKEDVELLRIR